jgi:hypothetical protein
MQFLFNSKGDHITNFVDDRLHAPSGKYIGHYLPAERIFIDTYGNYLGEIIRGDRLMYNKSSPYKFKIFSDHGTHSSAGSYGNPGTKSSIGSVSGYADVPISRLDT